MEIRVRLFAMQREAAGTASSPSEVADGALVEDAWAAAVAAVPALAPGRLLGALRGQRRVRGPDAPLPTATSSPASRRSAAARRRGRARILELRAEPFGTGLATELADRLATDEDGGVVTFVGRTRVTPGTPAPGQEADAARHAGRDVEELEYEAFEPLALRVLGGIADEIEARFGVARLAIVHRTGVVPLGEASILVVAAAAHRGAAFEAARYAIDETKARAPIWKAERFADGHVWIGDVARTGPEDRPEGA